MGDRVTIAAPRPGSISNQRPAGVSKSTYGRRNRGMVHLPLVRWASVIAALWLALASWRDPNRVRGDESVPAPEVKSKPCIVTGPDGVAHRVPQLVAPSSPVEASPVAPGFRHHKHYPHPWSSAGAEPTCAPSDPCPSGTSAEAPAPNSPR